MLNADDTDVLDNTLNDLTDKNLFAYCDNNPVNRSDEDGYFWETILDIGSIGWSAHDLIKKPSWANSGYLSWDVAAAALPFVPGSYAAKGLKASRRAISQVNKWNKQVQYKKYDSRVVVKNIQGRDRILKWERLNAERLKKSNDMNKHSRP